MRVIGDSTRSGFLSAVASPVEGNSPLSVSENKLCQDARRT
jgi:hypothetical protein